MKSDPKKLTESCEQVPLFKTIKEAKGKGLNQLSEDMGGYPNYIKAQARNGNVRVGFLVSMSEELDTNLIIPYMELMRPELQETPLSLQRKGEVEQRDQQLSEKDRQIAYWKEKAEDYRKLLEGRG